MFAPTPRKPTPASSRRRGFKGPVKTSTHLDFVGQRSRESSSKDGPSFFAPRMDPIAKPPRRDPIEMMRLLRDPRYDLEHIKPIATTETSSPSTPVSSRKRARVDEAPVLDSPLKRGFQYLCDNFIPSLENGILDCETPGPETPSKQPLKSYTAPGGFPGAPVDDSDEESSSNSSSSPGSRASSPFLLPPVVLKIPLHRPLIPRQPRPVNTTQAKSCWQRQAEAGHKGAEVETKDPVRSPEETMRRKESRDTLSRLSALFQGSEAFRSALEAEKERERKRDESRREREQEADRECEREVTGATDKELDEQIEEYARNYYKFTEFTLNPEIERHRREVFTWLEETANDPPGTFARKMLNERLLRIDKDNGGWMKRMKPLVIKRKEEDDRIMRAWRCREANRRRLEMLENQRKQRERIERQEFLRMVEESERKEQEKREEARRREGMLRTQEKPQRKPRQSSGSHFHPYTSTPPTDRNSPNSGLHDASSRPCPSSSLTDPSGVSPALKTPGKRVAVTSSPDLNLKKFSKDASSYLDWYDHEWAVINSSGDTSSLFFSDIPWAICPYPRSAEDVTPEGVRAFLEQRCPVKPVDQSDPAAKPAPARKKRVMLKKELLNWHPDKFGTRVLMRCASSDEREVIRLAADVVQRSLTAFITEPESAEADDKNETG